ncbi:MAG: WYL domain-containing protein [Gammaproteobacteria bacterium]
MAAFKSISDIKQATRQRLEYIEIMAFYTGVVSRSDVAKTFGLSDAAATKDLKLYGELAPDNLIYRHNVFGFVPSENFVEMFADLDPARVLPMIAANLPIAGASTDEAPIYGVTVDSLPLPNRLPGKQVLAQIIRAIRNQRKLSVVYRSLSGRGSNKARIIEPHSLINTGTRWHFRAYNEESYDFRDFVLSRVLDAKMLNEDAESSAQYDDDWMELVSLKLSPHPGLSEEQRLILMTDYSAENDVIEIEVRRALIGYLLQRLSVDTTADHSMNPNAYQLIVTNRDEVEPFAGWAFL